MKIKAMREVTAGCDEYHNVVAALSEGLSRETSVTRGVGAARRACSRARGITEADLANYGAKFGSPMIFGSLVEWADRVITE